MPNIPQNKRQALSVAKKAILDFARNLLPVSLLQAINILLSPCCDIVIESIVPVCNDSGNYDVTVNFTSLPQIYQSAIVSISIGNTTLNIAPDTASIIDGKVLFEDVDITGIGGPDTYGVQISFSILTGYPSNNGALVVGNIESPLTVVFPTCG